MDNKVVISGIGVVSPVGAGRARFWSALSRGESGIAPITLFKVFDEQRSLAAQVKDINFTSYLGREGLKWLDRSTKLLLTAVHLAMKDARWENVKKKNSRSGIVAGVDLASIQSTYRFDAIVLRDGPKQLNPTDFPLASSNAIAGFAAMRFGLEGINTTISRSFTSGIDAIGYSLEKIRNGICDNIIAGAVENLCIEFYSFLNKTGRLFPSLGRKHGNSGIVLGDGACVFMMESLLSAKKRKAQVFAQVLGYGFSFGDTKEDMKRSMLLAIEDAGLRKTDIDYICANFNGDNKKDSQESRAISDIFGDKYPPLTGTIKHQMGEGLGVSPAMQVSSVCLTFKKNIVPFGFSDKNGIFRYLFNGSAPWVKLKNKKMDFAMVNAFGFDGNNACLILGKV